jgi:hypothetical protein
MCVSATARTALERGFGVVLPHDAHATCDIAAAPGFGQAVPAAIVSRVAEWALGDQAELVASTEDAAFTAARPWAARPCAALTRQPVIPLLAAGRVRCQGRVPEQGVASGSIGIEGNGIGVRQGPRFRRGGLST